MRNDPWRHRTTPNQSNIELYHTFSIGKSERDSCFGVGPEGLPGIPANDLWIAASAMQPGLKVLTTDKHYLEIPQIITEYFETE